MEKYIFIIKYMGFYLYVEGDKLWLVKVIIYYEFCYFNINSFFFFELDFVL